MIANAVGAVPGMVLVETQVLSLTVSMASTGMVWARDS